jgi:hypothetical protein
MTLPSPSPSPTPIPVPAASPLTSGQQIPLDLPAASASATPFPVALPTVAGFATTMFVPLPQAATGTQLTVVISNVSASSSVPFSLVRSTQALRYPAALPSGAAVLMYGEIYSTATIVLPSAPGFSIVIPAADVFSGANYYIALYDPTLPSLGWQYGFEGPATPTNDALAFAANPAPFTLQGSVVYYFDLYVIPQRSAQPTPAPSALPTSVPSQSPPPIPTPMPTATPAEGGTIVIVVPTPAPVLCTPSQVVVAVGKTVLMNCAAAGYIGAFTWTVADPTIASVQLYNSETQVYFNVTGLKAGSTTLSLQSQPGGTGSVTIDVSP